MVFILLVSEAGMNAVAVGMTCLGVATLGSGLVLARERVASAEGAEKILALGPLFIATPLAMFAAEHFLDAHSLMGIVPKWLPGPLFWTYFFGVALLAAAVSFIVWLCVRWSALMLALFFVLVVTTVDLPNVSAGLNDRFFWILTVRETCFAAGAMVLAGSVWPRGWAGVALVRVGRGIVALTMIFYAIEHFLHPLHVSGVPLEKLTPGWVPAPAVLAYFIGLVLLLGGIGLFIRPMIRMAAAGAGGVLMLLTAFFYFPILLTEIHTPLVVEGLNYMGDTMLFAGTVLAAGLGANAAKVAEMKEEIVAAPPVASA
jgi:uncharacterized membrane protein